MSVDGNNGRVSKPAELLQLYDLTATLFAELKRAFGVHDRHQFSLADVDSAGDSLYDPTDKAAFAMRKLQALRHVAKPGVPTANTVVVYFIADLNTLLTSLAELVRDTDPVAYETLIDGRLTLNKAALAVSSIDGNGDVVDLI